MTNEQIQALKAAAENLATAEERYDRAEITIREYISVNDQYHNFVKDPANILSLLAERDADKALIAEQEKRIAELEARALLAAHEQEPVAYMCDGDDWREYNGHNEFSCGGPGIPLYTHPAPVPAVPEDYFASLVISARLRAEKAMRKFPQPNYVLNKVAEESGEVIKAVIHYTEGREEWANVEGEIIDNLAMLIRLVTEGDQVIGFTPPESCRGSMPQFEPVNQPYKLPEKVHELVSAVRSINRAKHHIAKGVDDDEPCYWQRKEWIDWVLSLCDEIEPGAKP